MLARKCLLTYNVHLVCILLLNIQDSVSWIYFSYKLRNKDIHFECFGNNNNNNSNNNNIILNNNLIRNINWLWKTTSIKKM